MTQLDRDTQGAKTETSSRGPSILPLNYMHNDVHHSITYNSKKAELTQLPAVRDGLTKLCPPVPKRWSQGVRQGEGKGSYQLVRKLVETIQRETGRCRPATAHMVMAPQG